MPECPTCGKQCRTLQGVRIHHTKVHGDPLPNLTCRGCDSEFYHPKADRAFCADCNHRAGEHNPNWKDAKKRTSCKLCDREFEYYPSDKKGVYCTDCVEVAPGFLGKQSHELRKIARLEKVCENCNISMVVLQSEVNRGRGRFCSAKCRDAWMRFEWENPHDAPYNRGWWEVRHRAYERDNHECQICGRSKEEIGKEPDAHHITPIRDFEDPAEAHTLRNVICLCRGCHRRAEIGLIPEADLRDAQE